MVPDRENSVVTQVNFSIRKNPHIVQYTCFFITKADQHSQLLLHTSRQGKARISAYSYMY